MDTLGVDMIIGKNETPVEAADWYTLDMASNGVLHVLLSNRSLTHLKQNDAAAAAVDAEAACLASSIALVARERVSQPGLTTSLAGLGAGNVQRQRLGRTIFSMITVLMQKFWKD